MSETTDNYQLVTLANGVRSVYSRAHDETFHPVIGPVAEAEALYVRQLRLPERFAANVGEFVVWDVGLGSAANVLTVLRSLAGLRGQLRIVSFDCTLEPLAFARQHAAGLGYPLGFEAQLETLLNDRQVRFSLGEVEVDWTVHVADFPALLAQAGTDTALRAQLPAPHAILYDAFSPATNTAMWTLPVFQKLHTFLDAARPCALPTYSRSTLLRVTLLLAGFYVGAGHATGEKEETTIAANSLDLLTEPLGEKWLGRVQRSRSAEPLMDDTYRQAPLSEANWETLRRHPQFLKKTHAPL
jgi:tRNA U34 5-methylaminomethyl-2-thiouridine-forming methyltransferase MnmC